MQMDLPSEAVSKCFSFRCFIFNDTPFPGVDEQHVYDTILFMNLIMIFKLHQWNKTYFNRQSSDLQSLLELCVAQPGRSQVTGRKEPCMVTRFCVAEFMSFILKPFFVWLFSFVVPKLPPAFVLWVLRLVQIFCPHCYMQHLDLSFDFISALPEFIRFYYVVLC